MIAIDTNVLFYTVDADAPEKQSRAISLITDLTKDPDVVVPWQAMCEFLNLLRRREQQRRMTRIDAEAVFQKVLNSFQLILPNKSVLDRAIDLFARYSLSHWDSLLLAACLEAGVTTLYSEDMGHQSDYDGLTVINPFAE